ncbi:quinon protein alcohol dehydrogenase-like superfamily [Zopfochytrium polystomum]|nr:quinon protein alcohol dehydrogenase-like superfamily [Zopfochytrium polystomum]
MDHIPASNTAAETARRAPTANVTGGTGGPVRTHISSALSPSSSTSPSTGATSLASQPYYIKPAKLIAQRNAEREAALNAPPSVTVVAQLKSPEGDTLGPPLSLPAASTPEQLALIVNELLQNEEPLPYTFHVDNHEILNHLHADILFPLGLTAEHQLTIIYQPQAVFRVRSVTRCSSSLSGHAEAVLAVAFSPNGEMLATAGGDGDVRIWDLWTETPKCKLKGHTNWVQILSWSPDGETLVSGSMDKTLRLWNPKKGTPMGEGIKAHNKAISAIVWEPLHLDENCNRFVSASLDGTAKVYNARTRQLLFSLSQHTSGISSVVWCGDGLICTGSRDKTIKVWSGTDGKLVRTLEGHAHWVNSLALSDGFALRTGAFDHTDTRYSDRAVARRRAEERYREAKGPGPERLASCSDDFTLFLWEPSSSKKPIARMTGHMQLVNHISFSPDGRYLASASFDKSVKLWDGRTGKFIDTLRGHVGAVYQVTFSSDSRQLLSASKDSTVKCWDLSKRKLKMDLPGHADEVFAVDWSPGGDKAASGGKDRMVKIWRH